MATIKILDVEKFTRGLPQVTSTSYETRTGEWDEEGLFSEKLFGVDGSLERQKSFAYIDLNAKVMHPIAYRELVGRIDRRLEKFFSTEESFSVTQSGELILDPGGVTGLNSLIDIFDKIKFKGGTADRESIIKLLKNSYNAGTLFISRLPVIPPHFRPAYKDEAGQWIVDELNEIYIKIMRQAAQLKSAGGAGPLFDLLNFRLQLAVNEHDAFIKRKIQKKSGIIRGSLLGKRVDFSGRAVITPGPNLKVNEVGLPLRMAVTLFEPFLKHYMIFSKKFPYRVELEAEIRKYLDKDLSVDSLQRVMKAIRSDDKMPDELYELFFHSAEVVIKDRVILAKRDPCLHDLSYRAFYPRLIRGNTVQLCTLQVGGFNADFDGDAMAFYHPITNQAQKEAKERLTRAIGSKEFDGSVFELSKEMAAGLYMMTRDSKSTKSPIGVTPEDLEKATDPYIPVVFRNQRTTMGRAIVNSAFPVDFSFINKQVNKKELNGLINTIITKYGEDVARETYSKLAQTGFKFATLMSPAMTLENLEIPDEIKRIKEKLDGASPDEAQRLLKQAETILKNHLKGTSFYDLIESGAAKGWDQPKQILIAKGVIKDPTGKVLDPIKGSFSDGLTPTEFFNAAAGARAGLADRTLNTADTGYFTRQLVYLLSPVEASPSIKDCKTDRTIRFRLSDDLIKRLSGRYIMRGSKILPFNKNEYKAGDVINLRTPIYCETHKVCHTCYGDLLRRHRSPYIGIIAATGIGERGTQLIMRTFHTGGAATIVEHDILEDLINNDPLLNIRKEQLERYLIQTNNLLVANRPCKVTIDLTNYKSKDTILVKKDVIEVRSLIAQVEFDDLMFRMVLDFPINIQRRNLTKLDDMNLLLEYIKGDTIIEVPYATDDLKNQVNYVGRLIGGKEVYKDPTHLLMKILKVYQKHTGMDLVHFEVLTSQVLRDRSHPEIPARLAKKWDPIMANIKNNVFASGFIQGLAFENINKAIETGLITEKILEPSVMEKLLTGELRK